MEAKRGCEARGRGERKKGCGGRLGRGQETRKEGKNGGEGTEEERVRGDWDKTRGDVRQARESGGKKRNKVCKARLGRGQEKRRDVKTEGYGGEGTEEERVRRDWERTRGDVKH